MQEVQHNGHPCERQTEPLCRPLLCTCDVIYFGRKAHSPNDDPAVR